MELKESENRERAVPRPELENLTKHLLVPRAQVGLREVNARVEPIDTQTKIRPVVIASNPTPDLTGLRSGQRSALLTVDGEAFKVEGCRIEKAFGKGKFYTTDHRATPVGGYLLSIAEKRIGEIQRINKQLTEEGWPVPYEPEAIIHYGREFRYSPYGIFTPFKKLSRDNPNVVWEELAAPVMRIKGDTKLSEFYPLKPEHSRAAREIAFNIGLMAGAQDRKMGTHAAAVTSPKKFMRYLQNFVIFSEGDQVYVGKVGDETAFLYAHVKDPIAEYRGVGELISTISTATSGDEEEQEEEEEDHTEEPEELAMDALKGSLSRKPYRHRAFREQFWAGYTEGRKNPDSRIPIAVDDLRAAYGLKE